MPLISKQALRRIAGSKGATQAGQVQVERSRGQLHGALARAQAHVSQNAARLEGICNAAEAQHAALTAQLPALRAKADSAVGEERDTHHRNYLRAAQNLHQCAQVHGAAKRELIIARNL